MVSKCVLLLKWATFTFVQTNMSQQTLVCLLGQSDKRFSQRSSTILALAHDTLTEPPSSVSASLCSRAARRIHMSRERYNVSTLDQFVGQELGVSEWLIVDQERINEFADCTDDQQWIHVDVERTKRESPLGSTIAHGYLTLSLLVTML